MQYNAVKCFVGTSQPQQCSLIVNEIGKWTWLNPSHFLSFYFILMFGCMRVKIYRFDCKDNIIHDSRQYIKHAQSKLQTGSVLKLLRQIVLICNMHCSLIFMILPGLSHGKRVQHVTKRGVDAWGASGWSGFVKLPKFARLKLYAITNSVDNLSLFQKPFEWCQFRIRAVTTTRWSMGSTER